jgi:DNA-directed RNA polymerase specialized sigma24 family protein
MQTMVLDGRVERGSRADHRAHHPAQPTAAATAELVARAGVGEQAAWDQLVDRYGAMVWAVARAHGLGPADAGDVSQVTWLLLTQHLGGIGEPERLGVWLLRTATREADRMRRLRRVPDAEAHDQELLLGSCVSSISG